MKKIPKLLIVTIALAPLSVSASWKIKTEIDDFTGDKVVTAYTYNASLSCREGSRNSTTLSILFDDVIQYQQASMFRWKTASEGGKAFIFAYDEIVDVTRLEDESYFLESILSAPEVKIRARTLSGEFSDTKISLDGFEPAYKKVLMSCKS
ncbi:MAG: hypothetical protein GYB40_13830 [Vibrionaceae bacterium]|nr:hypothetical protein [Vibrionaceae bacterium]